MKPYAPKRHVPSFSTVTFSERIGFFAGSSVTPFGMDAVEAVLPVVLRGAVVVVQYHRARHVLRMTVAHDGMPIRRENGTTASK